MIKAGKLVATGLAALCTGALLMSGSARAQYYDYGTGPGGPIYDAPPPARALGRDERLSLYEVRDLVRGLGYQQVSMPALAGRQYVVTATDEGAPVAIRVDAYSGRVVDVQPLVYGRSLPERDDYPPEALPGQDMRQGGRVPRAAPPPVSAPAPLPPPRPFAPGQDDGPALAVPQAGPRDTPSAAHADPRAPAPADGRHEDAAPYVLDPAAPGVAVSGEGPAVRADSEPADPGPAPRIVTPERESALPPASARGPATPQAQPSASVVPAAPQPAPAVAASVPDVGAGVGTPAGPSAGTASVLSRPPAAQ